MTEKFAERTAGIWLPMVFYILGGAYLLSFWMLFDRAAYYLTVLGGLSILVAVALFLLSKWAYWLGLFTFPLFLADFAYALLTSVNVVGWYPDVPNGLFQASIVVYLIFLVFSLVLLIDKRNTLKNDRVLDMLGKPLSATAKQSETAKSSGTG